MRTYTVEFDFFSTLKGVKPMAMMRGFKTEEEAYDWANEYTTDGIVVWEDEISE